MVYELEWQSEGSQDLGVVSQTNLLLLSDFKVYFSVLVTYFYRGWFHSLVYASKLKLRHRCFCETGHFLLSYNNAVWFSESRLYLVWNILDGFFSAFSFWAKVWSSLKGIITHYQDAYLATERVLTCNNYKSYELCYSNHYNKKLPCLTLLQQLFFLNSINFRMANKTVFDIIKFVRLK